MFVDDELNQPYRNSNLALLAALLQMLHVMLAFYLMLAVQLPLLCGTKLMDPMNVLLLCAAPQWRAHIAYYYSHAKPAYSMLSNCCLILKLLSGE